MSAFITFPKPDLYSGPTSLELPPERQRKQISEMIAHFEMIEVLQKWEELMRGASRRRASIGAASQPSEWHNTTPASESLVKGSTW